MRQEVQPPNYKFHLPMPESYKILIADDESLAIDSIRVLLEPVKNCEIMAIASNGKEALEKILIEEPDIVFIDIQMPFLNGIEVVQKINKLAGTIFIFVTAFEDHALKAFELNAVDYLLKPFSDERFYQSLNKAKNHIRAHLPDKITPFSQGTSNQQYREQFAIKTPGKITLVKTADIMYIKSSGNYLELLTMTQKHLIRMTIREAENELNPADFIRIHRSYIVRKTYIKELQTYFNGEFIAVLHNGDTLKVSRSFRHNIEYITR
jgi:two-component system LytT family response regulator